MSVRAAGQPSEHAEHLLQQERGQPELVPATKPDLTKPAYSDRTWENYTPRITWQISSRNKITGSWDEQPVCRKCTRHDVAHRLAELRLVRIARVGRPRRVQPAAHPAGEVDVAGHEQAAPRSRFRHDLLRVGRQAARGHLHREPGADVEPHPGGHADLQHGHALPLAVLVEQQDARLAVQRVGRLHHRFAQHEVRLPGRLLARRPRAARQQPEPRLHRDLAPGRAVLPDLRSTSTSTRSS